VGNGQAQQPSKSAEGIPSCLDVSWSFIPLALHGTARFGPAPLRATRLLLAPPVVSEERSVDQAWAWGRCPATRVRGRLWSVGPTPPSDGTMPPCARQLMR